MARIQFPQLIEGLTQVQQIDFQVLDHHRNVVLKLQSRAISLTFVGPASARMVESYYSRYELSDVLAADRAAEDD